MIKLTTRTNSLIDNDGNIIETLIFDKEAGVLYNPGNQESLVVETKVNQQFTACSPYSNPDYEYEFCSLGESYEQDYEEKVSDIVRIISGTIAVSGIVLAITSIIGIQLIGTASSNLFALSTSVYSLVTAGDISAVIRFSTTYNCTEMYESDPFHPNGGFYFLAYDGSPRDFSYSL